MMLRKLVGVLRAYRAEESLGDVVLLKLDALSSPEPRVTRRLEELRGYAPEPDTSVLRALPAGTLGREYARFLDANGITPLVVSDQARRRFRDRPYALRYTATYDLHHVLTGFDAGLAGEMGVLAFNVGQGSAPVSGEMLWVARTLYSLLAPTQAFRIWRNIRVGLALGRAAELVIAEPLESYFEASLEHVRERLRIPPPEASGVCASGRSVLGRLLYRPPPSAPRFESARF